MTTRDLPFERFVAGAAAAGYQGIGVLPRTVRSIGLGAVRRQADQAGLTITSLCAHIGLTHPDPASAERQLVEAEATLGLAARLGVPLVVVVGGPAVGLPFAAAVDQVDRALAALARVADDRGTEVLVEPLHPVLVNLSVLMSLRAAHERIATLRGTGLVLDTWHLWTDPNLHDDVSELGQSVRIVHLADWVGDGAVGSLDRELPGEGIAELAGLCRALLAQGFGGWWEVEVLSERYWAGDQDRLITTTYDSARRVLDAARTPPPSP